MFKAIIKAKIKLFLRNIIATFTKQKISHLIIFILGSLFTGQVILRFYRNHTFYLKQSYANKNEIFFGNQIFYFFILFSILIIYQVYRSYKHVDPCLVVFPVPEHFVLLLISLRLFMLIVLIDSLFILFYNGFLFHLETVSLSSIIMIVLSQFLFIMICFYIVFKIIVHKRIILKILLSFSFVLLAGIILKPNMMESLLRSLREGILKNLDQEYLVGLFLRNNNNILRLWVSLLLIAGIGLLYKRTGYNFNPMNLQMIREKPVHKKADATEASQKTKIERSNAHAPIRRSACRSLIVKDIRILRREVSSRILSVTIIASFMMLFAVDLLKSGKIIPGKLALIAILSYLFVLYSWIIALPSIGNEESFFGFLRNVVDIKYLLWVKILFSFIVNICLGIIVFGIQAIILLKMGYLDIETCLLIIMNIIEFALAFSLSGVLIGSFFANFKNMSNERLKKVAWPGLIIYFAVAAVLSGSFIIVDILAFVNIGFFLLGITIFNVLLFFISLFVLGRAEAYLARKEI